MPEESKQEGRDEGGKFAKGNRGGPGNPFTRRVAQLRTLLLSLVTDELLSEVVAKIAEMAKGGDLAAARLLLQYSLGQPQKALDPDDAEADEVRRMKGEAGNAALIPLALGRVTSKGLNDFARAAEPVRRQRIARMVDDAFAERAARDTAPPPPPAPVVDTNAEWEALVAEELRARAAGLPFELPPVSPLAPRPASVNEALNVAKSRDRADGKRPKSKRKAKAKRKRRSATR
jgi:hypothetical protein